MGGGILILVIMLIIWAVKSAKENMDASQFLEDTKDMSFEEKMYYSSQKGCKKLGIPPSNKSYAEHKRELEMLRKERELQEQREFDEEMNKLKAKLKYYKG